MALLHHLRLRRRLTAKPWLSILVMLLVVLAVLELTNTTHLLHKRKAVSGTIPATSSQTTAKTNQPTSAQPASNSQSVKAVANSSPASVPAGATPSGNLIAPYGTFVSNHSPGKNGSPTSEESTCQTSPFADCQIKFVQGSVTKTLPTQKTDSSGVADWQWNVSAAGLTSGSWQITAVATANGQTKTTTDPTALEIQ